MRSSAASGAKPPAVDAYKSCHRDTESQRKKKFLDRIYRIYRIKHHKTILFILFILSHFSKKLQGFYLI